MIWDVFDIMSAMERKSLYDRIANKLSKPLTPEEIQKRTEIATKATAEFMGKTLKDSSRKDWANIINTVYLFGSTVNVKGKRVSDVDLAFVMKDEEYLKRNTWIENANLMTFFVFHVEHIKPPFLVIHGNVMAQAWFDHTEVFEQKIKNSVADINEHGVVVWEKVN